MKIYYFMAAVIVATTLSFQNCSPVQFADTGDFSSTPLDVENPNVLVPVCSFNGVTYREGDVVDAFVQSSVASGEVCNPERRVCRDGSFTGSAPYAFCEAGAPKACLFDGRTLEDGQSITAYLNSSVGAGESCRSERRVCTDGALSGSYNFSSCQERQPANCLFNGQTVNHGTSVRAFQSSNVGFGQACTSESRVCNDGVLSGRFSFASCSVGQAASCTFDGKTIAHGQKVKAYLTSVVPVGGTCLSQDRTCANGVLSGNYSFGSCQPGAAASCSWNGRTIAHGEGVTAFSMSSVPFGSNCSRQTRLCNNGVLSGSYMHTGCSVESAKGCTFNGEPLAHGQSVKAYQVASGASCSSQSRLCTNGVLSGNYRHSSCTITTTTPVNTCSSRMGESCASGSKYQHTVRGPNCSEVNAQAEAWRPPVHTNKKMTCRLTSTCRDLNGSGTSHVNGVLNDYGVNVECTLEGVIGCDGRCS